VTDSDPESSSAREPSTYQGGIGSRREARERALGLLYEAEAKSLSSVEVVAAQMVPPEDFATELTLGVGNHLTEIDATIQTYAKDWSLDRMPSLDRALLRMGIFELIYHPEVPVAVVISEAVELAKEFSTDDSGKFVNGMLSAIAESIRRS